MVCYTQQVDALVNEIECNTLAELQKTNTTATGWESAGEWNEMQVFEILWTLRKINNTRTFLTIKPGWAIRRHQIFWRGNCSCLRTHTKKWNTFSSYLPLVIGIYNISEENWLQKWIYSFLKCGTYFHENESWFIAIICNEEWMAVCLLYMNCYVETERQYAGKKWMN